MIEEYGTSSISYFLFQAFSIFLQNFNKNGQL